MVTMENLVSLTQLAVRSASTCHGLALYAITRRREIGVDVERVIPWFADDQIAEQFFSPRERAKLCSLPIKMRTKAFFNCWTRKEAYIKAKGEGLSLSLDQFDVSLDPEEPAALLRPIDEGLCWSLRKLMPGH